MLEESIKIIKKCYVNLLKVLVTSFKGKYYVISNAVCNPKPIQKPYPPIWIGGGGKQTLASCNICRWLELWALQL
jgi:alkanesulfonate monooxygenase SsuD/methylene tetrahydromethanopterin reductase-like flavin-dependent oxidoreductase (luciferase family)